MLLLHHIKLIIGGKGGGEVCFIRVRALLGPYFALHDGFPIGPRCVQKIVKEVANRAQIRRSVTPHVLRHIFATLALQKGTSLATLKKILSHAHLSTSEISLNLTDRHIQEEYEQKW